MPITQEQIDQLNQQVIGLNQQLERERNRIVAAAMEAAEESDLVGEVRAALEEAGLDVPEPPEADIVVTVEYRFTNVHRTDHSDPLDTSEDFIRQSIQSLADSIELDSDWQDEGGYTPTSGYAEITHVEVDRS